MIIDKILDRKDGIQYNAKDFYNYCSEDTFSHNIAEVLDCGSEEEVKNVLCKYIIDNNYNPDIQNYINSVNWI